MEYSQEVKDFIDASVEGVTLQTSAHASWGFGDEESWDMDQGAGSISFHFADGHTASAAAQIIGTYNPVDSTFLWAWDHPTIDAALSEHARLVRAYGEKHHVPAFTERKVVCTEYEAWEFTAVAARLAEANGVYRAEAGGPWVYFTFGEVVVRKGA